MTPTLLQTQASITLPALLDAKHLQSCGLSRSMAYHLLNREDLPVVRIGKRVFMNRDLFFRWMDEQANQTQGGKDYYG